MEIKECYICNEKKDDILMSNICNCKDKSIHKKCFLKLVDTVELENSCSVCKETYKNVTVKKKRIPNFKAIFVFSILNCMFLLSLVLFLLKMFSLCIEIEQKNNECKEHQNATTVHYGNCNAFLNEKKIYFLALMLSTFFIISNTFALLYVFKCYKNKLFKLNSTCVYTRDDDPYNLLSRCESDRC